MKCHSILLMLLSMAISSCYKPGPTVYRPVNAAITNSFCFRPGSYWIYRDSVTGQLDSVVIVRYENKSIRTTNGGNDYSDVEDEHIYIDAQAYNISSSEISGNWRYDFHSDAVSVLLLEQDSTTVINSIRYDPLFIYSIDNTFSLNILQPMSDTAEILQVLPSYTIQGNSYSNIAVISHRYANTYNDVFYIAPGAGIVKMRLNHHANATTHVREVIRMDIIK